MSEAPVVEILDDQNKLRALWDKLSGLSRINVSAPIDFDTSSIVTAQDAEADKIGGIKGKPATEIRAVGLERGKLVAVKNRGGANDQWEWFHLFTNKKDGRFATELPITNSPLEVEFDKPPIVLYPNERLGSIKIEKNPNGFVVKRSTLDSDPSLNKDRDEGYLICREGETQFYSLDPKTFQDALRLEKETKK